MPKPQPPPGHFNLVRRPIGWRPATLEQLEKYKQLGGVSWLRARLDDEIDKQVSVVQLNKKDAL